MSQHHKIGTGLLSAELQTGRNQPELLQTEVSARIAASGLSVVSTAAARFDNQGATLVWILAESHLVMHLWGAEGFATLDLHVCDYRGSNAEKADRLQEALTAFCFAPGTESWQQLSLEQPTAHRMRPPDQGSIQSRTSRTT